MSRRLLALLLVLASVTPAYGVTRGELAWIEGFDPQNVNIACNGNGLAGRVEIDTSVKRSGAASIKLIRSGSTGATCPTIPAAGISLSGTIYVFLAIHVSSGGSTCAATDATGGNLLDLGEVQLNMTCANATNSYVLSLRENSSNLGSFTGMVDDTWYPIAIKITTGSGSATLEWYVSTNGTTFTPQPCASCTNRTIASVDRAIFTHWVSSGVASFITLRVDDFVMWDDPTSFSWPVPPKTYANSRGAKSATPTYNNWTKTGGTNIYDVWIQRTNPSLTYPGSQYAGNLAATATDLGQTEQFTAWDSGTAPTVPTTIANVTSIWGCRWDVYGARGGGTNRTYAYRVLYDGTTDDTTFPITLSSSAYALSQLTYDLKTTDYAKLNAMELGGTKVSTASGAPMLILDQYVQCAWSEPSATDEDMWSGEFR